MSRSTAANASAPGTPADREQSVTLITGDRVTLVPQVPEPAVEIQPGPGRAQVGFTTVRRGDEVMVIPRDVAALVAAQRIDRELFNITRLLADGYGDRDRGDLPLIVTGLSAGGVSAARSARAGLTIDRAIPALGVTAMHQAKSSPGAALALIQPATARAAQSGAGGPRIWLDRRLRLTLDRSVPQIGGPAAWARGLTGQGVTVAVLDSGIDASHPDLADNVVDSVTFVEDGLGTSDVNGHATHVASTIAGSGAASGGQFRGVAPDARLLSGRVCDGSGGCPESAILAGMAWAAVDKHAPIVNLSLGGPALPGDDPLEDAVNQLSAQYGTLFVIAAGNTGLDQSIESPGSAEAALTVGAVDRDDQLAGFSSRGPNLKASALKPDITAPGVEIVAALATTVPPRGEPVGTAYQALSGTSMATPHVAGAAAILLQQHPGWTGAQLKAALMGTASANPELTLFEQGAGRVDLDRATRQHITAQTGSIDLGVARWPHGDDPVLTRTVTYRNDGPEPITLTLAASFAAADGSAAPAGMIHVAPAALTVPVGGSADAVVTVDTRGEAPDSRYTGVVVASADDTRVITPLTVVREVESYDLTLRVTARSGDPGASTVFVAARHPDGSLQIAQVTGQRTLRLPRDAYAIHSQHDEPVYLFYSSLELDHDAAVELDARAARPVEVTVPGVSLVPSAATVVIADRAANLILGEDVFSQVFTAQLGPEFPAELSSMFLLTSTPVDADPGVAERYRFIHREPGHLPTGLHRVAPRGQLATIHGSHLGDAHSVYFRTLTPFVDPASPIRLPFEQEPAVARYTEHLFGATRWAVDLSQIEQVPSEPGGLARVGRSHTIRDYLPGQRYVERWNRAPFGPAFAQDPFHVVGSPFSPATRRGDTVTLLPSLYADQGEPARFAWAEGFSPRHTLFCDGQKLREVFTWLPIFPNVTVPPDAVTCRYEQEQTRGLDITDGTEIFDLSTFVSAAWTFRSKHVDGDAPEILALPTPRFQPELDDDNRATSRVIVLPVAIERPVGAATPRIDRVTVDVSFDDGATWTSVPGALFGERWFGIVVHPAGAAYASLRSTVRDVAGNTGDVTIVHAYRLAGSRPAQH